MGYKAISHGLCNGDKPAPGESDVQMNKTAWKNIVNASGTDQSGGAKYLCVGVEPPCGHPNKCATCYCTDKDKNVWKRGQGEYEVENTGQVTVGSDTGVTVYFFNLKGEKEFNGWCTEGDQKNSLSHAECTKKTKKK